MGCDIRPVGIDHVKTTQFSKILANSGPEMDEGAAGRGRRAKPCLNHAFIDIITRRKRPLARRKECDCALADGGPSCWAAPPLERREPAMELALAVTGLLTTLPGAAKALLELLRSGREKVLNQGGQTHR